MDVGNDFENEKLSDWLAKNKNQLININPNNFYFTQYYYHLQEYFNSKIQSKPIIQNIIYNVENPINAKKESFNKIKPSHLKDILINDMTEVKFRKTIDENFEIRKGKYFTKGKKQFEVRNNLFKYFFELLEKGNFVQAEPMLQKLIGIKLWVISSIFLSISQNILEIQLQVNRITMLSIIFLT